MPQLGIHLAVGLLGNRYLKKRHILLGMGFFLGNVFPDFDFLLLIPIRFVDRDLALMMHRSLTHSLIFLMLLLIFFVVFNIRKNKKVSNFILGFIIGISLHILLDIFMWFSAVDIFWPLSHDINIYRRLYIPDLIWNITSGIEPACYGIFLILLGRVVKNYNHTRMNILITILFIATLILLVFTTKLPRERFELYSYGLAITVGFLPSIYYVISFRSILFKEEVSYDKNKQESEIST